MIASDPVIDRRAILIHLAALLVGPLGAAAQSREAVSKIGFLRPGQPPKEWVNAFVQGLRELGYVEGRNLVLEYRFTDGSLDQLPHLADDLVRLKVDVLVASGAPAVVAAQKVTTTVPVVFVGANDPVRMGLVSSLARPGTNITGLALSAADPSGKRLELLREIVPKLTRVAVLWHPENPTNSIQLENARAAAVALNLQLQPLPVSGPADFEGAFKMARSSSGLILLDTTLLTTHRRRLAELALKNRLPTVQGIREMVEAGGLCSYGQKARDLYRRAAAYVDKILKGAKAGDLPVEQPQVFELVGNLKTAKALGVTIPQTVLLRADEVIS